MREPEKVPKKKSDRQMNEASMSEALDAIYEEALKLLQRDLPEGVAKKIELISSIARYKFDVRDEEDLKDQSK